MYSALVLGIGFVSLAVFLGIGRRGGGFALRLAIARLRNELDHLRLDYRGRWWRRNRRSWCRGVGYDWRRVTLGWAVLDDLRELVKG